MNKSVSIICTHNNRMQCLLDKLGHELNKNIQNENIQNETIKKEKKKIRFQNCAILRFVISPKGTSVNLVYNGELDPNEGPGKRPYYVNRLPSQESLTSLSGFENWIAFKEVQFTSFVGVTSEHIFYVVRHGQATHNLKKFGVSVTGGMESDTNLTGLGIEQAGRAGEYLAELIKGDCQDGCDLTLFASDLVRSRQTIRTMLDKIYDEYKKTFGTYAKDTKGYSLNIPNKIVVLPCASEIDTVGDGTGNCDSANIFGGLARENYPNCTKSDIEKSKPNCNSIDGITVDWSFYLTFYGGFTRGDFRFNSKRQHCRDTNMLLQAIKYLSKSSSGGTKRRKATKKRTRKPKTKKLLRKTKRRR